jgi:ribosomal protein S18 acetylase RimI-like enzyme
VPALEFRRYDAAGARSARELVAEVHRDAYGEGTDFSSDEEFMRRYDAYTARDGFDLLFAELNGAIVGQAWGWPLDENATKGWWAGLLDEPDPDFTREDGHRTFALSEIMVRKAATGQGIAHALHDELLSARAEERATLLVRPANTKAYQAYLRWGWKKTARLRPAWPDAPTFDVLILPLPINR